MKQIMSKVHDNEKRCGNVALDKMYWPGEPPVPICGVCKPQAEAIAEAMGFHLPFELADPGMVCQQIKKVDPPRP